MAYNGNDTGLMISNEHLIKISGGVNDTDGIMPGNYEIVFTHNNVESTKPYSISDIKGAFRLRKVNFDAFMDIIRRAKDVANKYQKIGNIHFNLAWRERITIHPLDMQGHGQTVYPHFIYTGNDKNNVYIEGLSLFKLMHGATT